MTDTTDAPGTPAVRLSESLHLLVDTPTRAAILGLAEITAKELGGRPREGETIRDLLDRALCRIANDDRARYTKALRLGRAELARRKRS